MSAVVTPSRWRLSFNREMRRWHWISAAVCLAAVLLFSTTGITLNHAASIPARPDVTIRSAALPADLLAALPAPGAGSPLAPALRDWLEEQVGADVSARPIESSDDEVYLSMPSPGVDAWLAIDRTSGTLEYEATDRGWIAFFNDVHKGRHTGLAWRLFIDVVALACVVFSLTGLVLLQAAARQRKSTWPLVGGGFALVGALLIFFLH